MVKLLARHGVEQSQSSVSQEPQLGSYPSERYALFVVVSPLTAPQPRLPSARLASVPACACSLSISHLVMTQTSSASPNSCVRKESCVRFRNALLDDRAVGAADTDEVAQVSCCGGLLSTRESLVGSGLLCCDQRSSAHPHWYGYLLGELQLTSDRSQCFSLICFSMLSSASSPPVAVISSIVSSAMSSTKVRRVGSIVLPLFSIV